MIKSTPPSVEALARDPRHSTPAVMQSNNTHQLDMPISLFRSHSDSAFQFFKESKKRGVIIIPIRPISELLARQHFFWGILCTILDFGDVRSNFFPRRRADTCVAGASG